MTGSFKILYSCITDALLGSISVQAASELPTLLVNRVDGMVGYRLNSDKAQIMELVRTEVPLLPRNCLNYSQELNFCYRCIRNSRLLKTGDCSETVKIMYGSSSTEVSMD